MAFPCFNETPLPDSGNVSTADPLDPSSAVEFITWLIMDIAVPFMCCLGLLGNLLSLVVLATERVHRTLSKMEISAHIGLIALAVSDFLFCLLVLTITQVTPKNYYEQNEGVIYFHLMSDGLITIFIIASTWLIVVMAAERYIAVCHPLRARKLISLRRTRVVTFLVFLLCSLATVPIFLERTIEEARCVDGRSVYTLRQRREQSVLLRRILWAVFFDFIPCIALIYFNACLIVQIRKAKRLREDLTLRQSTVRPKRKKKKKKKCDSAAAAEAGAAAAAAAPGTTHAGARRKHNEVTLMVGGELVNNKSSQALLRPDNNGCGRKHNNTAADTTSADNSNYKLSAMKTNEETLEATRHWNNNGHGGGIPCGAGGGAGGSNEPLRPNSSRSNSPRSSWVAAGVETGIPRPTSSRTNELHAHSTHANYHEASKLNHVRRGVKTSTVKKRPSDSALNSVTATLVAVVILFLILVSPCEILKFSLNYTLAGEHRLVLKCITNFMQVTNFSLNFLLYCAVNKSFRYTLKRLTFSCWNAVRHVTNC